MKKVILLLVTVLAFNLSNAQSQVEVSMFQNVNTIFDDLDIGYEFDLKTKSGANFAFGFNIYNVSPLSVLNKIYISAGYGIGNEYITFTPSIKLKYNNIKANTKPYIGGDADFDIKLSKVVSLTWKAELLIKSSEALSLNRFVSNYYAGLKFKL